MHTHRRGRRDCGADPLRPARRAAGERLFLFHLVILWQAVQVFSEWVTQTIRLYEDANFIEVTYTVGPVPFLDGEGREVVTVWTTGAAVFVISA